MSINIFESRFITIAQMVEWLMLKLALDRFMGESVPTSLFFFSAILDCASKKINFFAILTKNGFDSRPRMKLIFSFFSSSHASKSPFGTQTSSRHFAHRFQLFLFVIFNQVKVKLCLFDQVLVCLTWSKLLLKQSLTFALCWYYECLSSKLTSRPQHITNYPKRAQLKTQVFERTRLGSAGVMG